MVTCLPFPSAPSFPHSAGFGLKPGCWKEVLVSKPGPRVGRVGPAAPAEPRVHVPAGLVEGPQQRYQKCTSWGVWFWLGPSA